jgi:UDP-N-acetylmuramoylalanine--D-glutamate ligase
VVVNPAVPADAPFLVAAVARGIPLVSEVGLFFAQFVAKARGRLALVTGSKGKTTTTSLLHAMVSRHDPRAIVGGNIGAPLLATVHEVPADATVIFEVSSFQLEQLRGLERAPAVTVITNVFPVHIDRHGTFADYKSAKAEALIGARSRVLNADDPESATFAAPGARWFSTRETRSDAYRVQGDELLASDGERLLHRRELRIPGLHNAGNALAAFAAADVLGVPRESARAAAREFRGVAHRLEDVNAPGAIRFINDSIATTPQSAIAALEALDGRVVLIAGGKESPFELSDLARTIVRRATALFAIGETGIRLVAAVLGADPTFAATYVGDLERAVARAREIARSGDTILLSPAFPSFDQFRNFKERGERFRTAAFTVA